MPIARWPYVLTTQVAKAAALADHQRGAKASEPSLWLGLAQVGWVIAALLALGIYAVSLPAYVLSFGKNPFPGHGIDAPAWFVLLDTLSTPLVVVITFQKVSGKPFSVRNSMLSWRSSARVTLWWRV